MAEKHPITVELGPDRFVWKDDGVIDVVMTPLVNNVETIYIPGLPDNVGYTSSGCTVTGTIEGSTVTGGIGGLDRMYVEPGMTSHLCKTAVLEHYWIVWNSLMEDECWQTGNVWLGEGDFATALFNPPGDAPSHRDERGRDGNGSVGDRRGDQRAGVGDVVVRGPHVRMDLHPQRDRWRAVSGGRAPGRVGSGGRWPEAGQELVGHGGDPPPSNPSPGAPLAIEAASDHGRRTRPSRLLISTSIMAMWLGCPGTEERKTT